MDSLSKVHSWLVWACLGLFTILIFGILWFMFIAPANPSGGAGWFLFSFAAGLTMIVLPCTFPLAFVIVPLSMGKGVVKGIGMALAFGIGVAITLSLYGIVAALIGKAAIGSLGAPLEIVKNWVYFIAGIFAYLFALGSIGLLKFKMPTYTGAAPAIIQKKQDILKAFLMGLFMGNIGVGCPHPATPLILVEIATSGNVLYGWLLFLVHAIGRIVPLLLLAFLGILGVNGLAWLTARREKVERATGWAMVFVAAFIMTLGLFTHDWWVNSGQHTLLESITQEEALLNIIGENLGTGNAHHHGLMEGSGLFGLPLWLGNWFLVVLWALPFFWYYRRERVRVLAIPNTNQVSEKLEEEKVLNFRRNFYIAVILTLGLIFIYILPHRFYEQAKTNVGHVMSGMVGMMSDALSIGNTFSRDIGGLSEAKSPETIELSNGDVYNLNAMPVWKVINGKKVKMFGYNGMIPGPTIKVQEGAEVTIRFTNNLDIDSTVHSHGVRLDNAYDGVAGVTQSPVRPGESFDYKIKFTDPGIFWYHPHLREDYSQELGLYGNYIVAPKDKNYWNKVDQEIPLFLDDILLDEVGIVAFPKNMTDHAIMGRYGSAYLLEGRDSGIYNPIVLKAGEVARLYFTNSSNVRTMKIGITGGKMKLAAGDQGKFSEEKIIEHFLISPGERIVVEVMFDNPGEFQLVSETPVRTSLLGVFKVDRGELTEAGRVFEILRQNDIGISAAEFAKYLAMAPDKRLRLGIDMLGMEEMDGMMDESMPHTHSFVPIPTAYAHGGIDDESFGESAMPMKMNMENMVAPAGTPPVPIEWEDHMGAMNAMMTSKNVTWKIVDEDTGKANMDIDWKFRTGDMVKVRIFNDPKSMHPMQHPIHFHGQRFLVLAVNGVANENLVWKDTTLVQTGDTADVLIDMSNPGTWMAHCHIAEHLHSGMMFSFSVGDTLSAVIHKANAGTNTAVISKTAQEQVATANTRNASSKTHSSEITPLQKTTLVFLSLLLMGGLSYCVRRYLQKT